MARSFTPGDRAPAADFSLLKSAKLAAESDSPLLSSRRADLEAKLKEEKDRYDVLDANFSELELRKFAAEKEAEKHKRVSDQLQDQLDRATEDIALLTARDQRAQERINFLLEELRQKEKELAAKFVELKVENQDFKCAKRRAQEEAEQWKRKYCEVQARMLELFDENLSLRAKTGAVEKSCVIEVSDEEGGGKEPRADGVEMTSPRRTPVASGGGDNRKDWHTVAIGKLKRKRETDVIKSNGSVGKATTQIPSSNGSVGKATPQIPASNGSVGKATPQISASNGSVGKVTPQQLEKRLRILTPVAIYDVRTA